MKNLPTNLSNSKSKAHRFLPIPIGSNKLSDVVQNDNPNVLYNTQSKILKIKYLTLATTVALSAKVNEVKNKIPNTTILANTNALTALKMKYHMFVIYSKNLSITQKFVELKIKLLLIMIMVNILLLKNLIT